MKKVLLILIIGIMTSCAYKPVDGNTTIPQNIMIEVTNGTLQTDTLIFATDGKYHYYFNNVKNIWVLSEKYDIGVDDINLNVFYFAIIIVVVCFIGIVIGKSE